MNKIKNIRLLLLLIFSVAITTALVTTTTLSSQIVYSEDKIDDNNFGKLFGAPGLSIQQANSGVISKINSTSYLLELEDVSEKTITLADGPDEFYYLFELEDVSEKTITLGNESDRFVKSRSTFDFTENWSNLIGVHSTYGEAPPNAALIFDNEKGIQEIYVTELHNPVYNIDQKTLKYDFTILDNSTFDNLPMNIGHSALIIDGL